jgi:phage shock protein A
VAKVYPELVIRDEKGRIDGVRYEELAPMLLNEVQRQQQKIEEQAARLGEVRQQLAKVQVALLNLGGHGTEN